MSENGHDQLLKYKVNGVYTPTTEPLVSDHILLYHKLHLCEQKKGTSAFISRSKLNCVVTILYSDHSFVRHNDEKKRISQENLINLFNFKLLIKESFQIFSKNTVNRQKVWMNSDRSIEFDI